MKWDRMAADSSETPFFDRDRVRGFQMEIGAWSMSVGISFISLLVRLALRQIQLCH